MNIDCINQVREVIDIKRLRNDGNFSFNTSV